MIGTVESNIAAMITYSIIVCPAHLSPNAFLRIEDTVPFPHTTLETTLSH